MKPKSTRRSPRERRPSIEAIRALAMLAETGSVSETARRLGLAQPVISKKLHIFKDAEVCGAILLRTSGATVELTEAAQSALPAIQELIARYDRLMRFWHGEETESRVLRIGVGSFAAEYYLPGVISKLRKELEDCQVETQVCRGRERILGTARGAYDLSIVTHDRSQIRQVLCDERIVEAALTIETLGRHAMAVLARKDSQAGLQLSELAEDQIVPLKSLEKWELIGPDRQSGLRRQLEQKLRTKSLYFAVEGGGWTAAKQFAVHGLGVALVPQATITDADQKKTIHRRLSPDFDITDFLLSRADESSEVVLQAKKSFFEGLHGNS